ncbi:tyrosine-type recombinase/integrase [Chloroflexota bacterium]
MRGHIVKRYKNSYTIVLNLGIDPSTGKRKQQWVSAKGTRKEAEKKLAELLHQLDTGTFMKPGRTTLGEFLERWLKDYAWPNLAPRTAEGYEHIIHRHLIPALGNMTLTQLKPEHLQRYYSDKLSRGRCDGKGGLSPKTVRHHHVTLHGAMQSAIKWGLLLKNPADAVDLPHYQRPEMNTLNEDDIYTLLDAAKKTLYYPLFHLALFTGMRRSELLALRWSDVNLLLCQVSVSRTLHHLRDGSAVFRAPKTTKGRRMVALSPSSALILREHRENQETLRAMIGKHIEDSDLVFSQVDGRPLLPDTITHAWIKLVRRVGLKGIRLHDARHSHASLMLKQGTHPKIVQERLGHASIQITLDTYSHVTPGLQEAAATRFDEGLLPKKKSEAKNEAVEILR